MDKEDAVVQHYNMLYKIAIIVLSTCYQESKVLLQQWSRLLDSSICYLIVWFYLSKANCLTVIGNV